VRPKSSEKDLAMSFTWSVLMAVALVSLAGCARPQTAAAPPPPPAAPSPPAPDRAPAPPAPPRPMPELKEPLPAPVLAPQMGAEEEARLSRTARSRIDSAEQSVSRVDLQRLGKDQREAFATARDFLAKAREALWSRDFSKAVTLAEKAQILADDLARAGR